MGDEAGVWVFSRWAKKFPQRVLGGGGRPGKWEAVAGPGQAGVDRSSTTDLWVTDSLCTSLLCQAEEARGIGGHIGCLRE